MCSALGWVPRRMEWRFWHFQIEIGKFRIYCNALRRTFGHNSMAIIFRVCPIAIRFAKFTVINVRSHAKLLHNHANGRTAMVTSNSNVGTGCTKGISAELLSDHLIVSAFGTKQFGNWPWFKNFGSIWLNYSHWIAAHFEQQLAEKSLKCIWRWQHTHTPFDQQLGTHIRSISIPYEMRQ